MYKIITVDGIFVAAVETVNYVRRDNLTKSWIAADPAAAQAVSVNGTLYNIAGYPVIVGYPIVKILETMPEEGFKWQSKDQFFVQRA